MMAGSADRAINMALRVKGIDAVARDFKKVGDAGSKEFERVEKAANKAAKATSAATSPKASKSRAGGGVGAGLAASGFNPKALGGVNDANKSLDLYIDNADSASAASGRLGSGVGVMGGFMAGAAIAVLGLGLAVVKSAQAYMEHERALDAFNATLDLAGNASTATSGQITQMAEDIARSTLQTEKSVLQAAASLAQVPGITEATLQSALEASSLLADALGKDVTETAAQAGEILTALADRDMKGLLNAMEGLNPSLQLTVLSLAEAGKTADAQTALIAGLKDAAGDGPDGLTSATDRLSDAWGALQRRFYETDGSVVTNALSGIANWLDSVRAKSEATGFSLLQTLLLYRNGTINLDSDKSSGVESDQGFNSKRRGGLRRIAESAAAERDRKELAGKRKFYGGGGSRPRRGGGGGGGGKSDAQREAEKTKREAEALEKRQAREAEAARESADRITESNRDVIDSYKLRAAEAQAKIGLEGAALKAVERAQEIDAAERRINIDLIEKEVEARRTAAIVAKQVFDEPQAREAARRAVALQAAEVRMYAASLIDAGDAIDLFNEKQAFAKSLFEETRTPVEALVLEAKRLSDEFNRLGGDADSFNRKMDQLAEQIVDAADRSKNAWVGFGDDVGGVFADLLLNGGSARDVLQELIRLPLERLIQTNVQDPIAGFIDGLTGNNRDKNIAEARAGLPTASDGAAVSVTALGGSAEIAAQALATIPLALQSGLGNPLADLAIDAEGAGKGLGELIPLTNQFGGALGQLIASLSGGGGGGGGALGSILGLAGTFLGSLGGSSVTAGMSPEALNVWNTAGAPGFAGGGYAPRSGAFYVGENGRELAEYTSQGLKIHSNDNVRRMEANSAPSFVNYQTINVPERADKRRTGRGIARNTQHALGLSLRSGLARGPRR